MISVLHPDNLNFEHSVDLLWFGVGVHDYEIMTDIRLFAGTYLLSARAGMIWAPHDTIYIAILGPRKW